MRPIRPTTRTQRAPGMTVRQHAGAEPRPWRTASIFMIPVGLASLVGCGLQPGIDTNGGDPVVSHTPIAPSATYEWNAAFTDVAGRAWQDSPYKPELCAGYRKDPTTYGPAYLHLTFDGDIAPDGKPYVAGGVNELWPFLAKVLDAKCPYLTEAPLPASELEGSGLPGYPQPS